MPCLPDADRYMPMDQLDSIFRQIQDWEHGPIDELFGGQHTDTSGAAKRIMLYGPTQVGKTTLLMHLIGIKPEMQNTLDEILRGGETMGNSSTSTAVIYSRWDKEEFGLLTGTIDLIPKEEPLCFGPEAFTAKIRE